MTPELLAPAGSMEALKAAVCAGADAVYLGAAAFGARAAVGFSPDELRQALRFAHLHGRRIYVTVNTLVKDGEWDDLRAALARLRDLRADAVLIQDLGVLQLCREEFPELTLHASTQMSLHTPSGIRWAAGNGIRRVVLNREATLEDIRAAAETGIEVEVFAHGALCVSVSGQCALSASLGERSGNRGRCAQPCRLPYRYRDREQAWLSPADLCALPQLRSLADVGVSSLKLEGRLKRPEYVYIVTDVYRRALDRLAEGPAAPEEDMKALQQIFCRGRFTQGYAAGLQDAGVLNPGHTAHEGVRIGQIARTERRGTAVLAHFIPEQVLHDQDGLSVGDDKCIYTGPGVPAGQTATLRLHRSVPAGTAVLRTESTVQLDAARSGYGPEALSRLRLPFDAVLCVEEDRPSLLTLESEGVSVQVEGPAAPCAEKRPLDEAAVRQALSKTGDAPFYLAGLQVKLGHVFLASAQLNALRREGLRALEDAVIAQREAGIPRTGEAVSVFTPAEDPVPAGQFYVRTEQPEEIANLLDAGADRVLLALKDVTAEGLRKLHCPDPDRVILLPPPVCDDEALRRITNFARSAGLPLAADNAGQLGLAPDILLTAEGIPVFNTQTERFLCRHGVRAAVLSPELSGREITAMGAPRLERILCVYGRQRLMLLTHCPERVSRGLTAGHSGCRLCETGDGVQGQCLTDRKGMRLPLMPYRTDRGCTVRLYSSRPLSLMGRMPELRRQPLSFLLSFTDEPAPGRLRILRAFRDGAPCRIDGTEGKYPTGVL